MNTPTVYEVVSQGVQRLSFAGYLKVEEGMIDAWAAILSDITPALLVKSFEQVERTFKKRFYDDKPMPPLIREIALSLVTGEWSDAFEECVLAAERMENPMMTTDVNGNLVQAEHFQFSSPLVAKAFHSFGGFPAFQGMKDGDRTIRAQFRDVYQKSASDVQGLSNGIKNLSEYKDKVTHIGEARMDRQRLQNRVEQTRDVLKLKSAQKVEDERIKAKAEKIMQALQNARPGDRQQLMCEFLGIKGLDFGDEADHG